MIYVVRPTTASRRLQRTSAGKSLKTNTSGTSLRRMFQPLSQSCCSLPLMSATLSSDPTCSVKRLQEAGAVEKPKLYQRGAYWVLISVKIIRYSVTERKSFKLVLEIWRDFAVLGNLDFGTQWFQKDGATSLVLLQPRRLGDDDPPTTIAELQLDVSDERNPGV